MFCCLGACCLCVVYNDALLWCVYNDPNPGMEARDLLMRLLLLCTVVSASKFRSVSCLCQYLVLSLIIVLLVVSFKFRSVSCLCQYLILSLIIVLLVVCLLVVSFKFRCLCQHLILSLIIVLLVVVACLLSSSSSLYFLVLQSIPSSVPSCYPNSNPGFYCLQASRESTFTPRGSSDALHTEVPSPERSTTPSPWPRMAASALTRHRSRAGAQVARGEVPES